MVKIVLLTLLIVELLKASKNLVDLNNTYSIVDIARLKEILRKLIKLSHHLPDDLLKRIEKIIDDLSDDDLPGGVK